MILTFILIVHDVLFLHHLHISLIRQFKLLQVLIDFSQFISILLKVFLQFIVNLFLPSPLFLLFQLADSFGHTLSDLFWSLLHIDNLLLVNSVFVSK